MRGGLLCQAGRSNDLHKAHPIKGVGGEVEDHSKALEAAAAVQSVQFLQIFLDF